jgi:hypothetical protein
MKLLNKLTLTDIRGKIINTKDVKIKIIQKILNNGNATITLFTPKVDLEK